PLWEMDTGCPRPARPSTPRRQTSQYRSNGPRSKRYSAATCSPPPLGLFPHRLESPALEFVHPHRSRDHWARKSSPHPRVQDVPQPVAQQVESEDSEEHRQPRNDTEPRRLIHEASAAIQHVPPRGLRWLGAQSEKAQGRLEDDGVRKRLHGLHDERSGDVRKDLASQNA